MRDCWVGHIADYAKYGLVRRSAGDDLRVGVIWYRTTAMESKRPLVT
jgi:hypothetical protein